MDKIFNAASFAVGIAGGILVKLFGNWDAALAALVILMALDYVSGVVKAIYKKELSSYTGYRGILKKMVILVMVAAATTLQEIIGAQTALREMVIMFYIANEGISILENAAEVAPNMPPMIKDILMQIRGKGEDTNGNRN